ncbi:MAG: Hsp70 family protein, partial [Vicinamibacterales bacterium]
EVDKMMKEAEAHAEDDKKRKEEIETRNQADHAAYAAEAMLKEAGDKIPASERQPVESALEDLKKAIEKNDVAEMKRGMEALNTSQHKMAETMYKSAQASGGAGASDAQAPGADAGQPSGSAATGDVIDAEVVEEEKK